jgi:uncharacterized cysteine cluster protein YcgN (CxxCxxCC family)
VKEKRKPVQGLYPLANGRSTRAKLAGARMMSSDETPFWRRKSLLEMTNSEWESLCDGCGRCCLVKLEDADDSARTYFTDVGCRLLDGETCRCRDYAHRTDKVKDCVRLTPRNVKKIVWLPPTCAYRRLADGHDLYWWHPLVSGDPETVHQAGISVRGRVGAHEDEIAEDELEDRIVSWPSRLPASARRKPRSVRRS